MLADATGLGKTFVALAVTSAYESALIVCPASLADAWRTAIARTRVNAEIISMERLSRAVGLHVHDPQLVVIDEAHHFRNQRTKRYNAAAALCDRADVLLLSATPLQNRRADLVTQFALFLGDRSSTATDDELARLIVRRRAEDMQLQLPVMHGPRRVELPVDDDLLDDLLALPPPLPGNDEGDAGVLMSYSLLRQWASSRAALVATLRRRLTKAVALVTSLEAGRWPTRDELLAWSCDGDAVQLALPELVAQSGVASVAEIHSMRDAVYRHADALRGLLARLRTMPDPDPGRAIALAKLCDAHPGTRIIAFSQYAETVHALSRLLMMRRAGVAELTARGGRVVGGRVSRRHILAQFAPSANDSAASPADHISLLVTTDVLSEGLDLQRASVVVHLDLPWNPARLEQRVGRVRRLGAMHDAVFVYALAPPATSERVLHVESRLHAKLNLASRIVGLSTPIADSTPNGIPLAPPEIASDVLATLERWLPEAQPAKFRNDHAPITIGVLAPNDGLLALMLVGDDRLLIAAVDANRASAETSVVAAAVAMCHGTGVLPTTAEREAALRGIGEWWRGTRARNRLRLTSTGGTRVRAQIRTRITQLLSSAPRHERAVLTPLASQAQHALRVSLGARGERALADLAVTAGPSHEWLRRIAALAEQRVQRGGVTHHAVPSVVIVLRRATTIEPS
jgi:hypothetical protein